MVYTPDGGMLMIFSISQTPFRAASFRQVWEVKGITNTLYGGMASLLSTPLLVRSQLNFLASQNLSKVSIFSNFPTCKILRRSPLEMSTVIRGSSLSSDLIGPLAGAINSVRSNPSTWQSAVAANIVIFILGTPILVTGLSLSGIASAFLLGNLTWRAFGPSGFLLVASYFVLGTAATKVKMAQKEAQGVAEKRKGRRGPASVIGSSAAGCVCALLSISGVGGKSLSQLWQLGFVASFCTKLSDTVSSEIGKAYGKTTYLVTTFKVVPRGTEGAMSLEGTLAGLLASIVLAAIGCITSQINVVEAVICVLAAQLANLGESVIGASFQDKEGFRWLNNDAVNIINISMGSILALLLQQIVLHGWLRVM